MKIKPYGVAALASAAVLSISVSQYGITSIQENVAYALKTGQSSLEIKGVPLDESVFHEKRGEAELVTLLPGTSYSVAFSADGDRCNYHYSGKDSEPIKGAERRDMIVPETAPGSSVVHVLTCTSGKGTTHTTKMLIIKIASSKAATSVIVTK